MRKVRFVRVDVFSKKRFSGNMLAVFPDAKGLTTNEMQALAMEMNLSETTFVLPPTKGSGADFKVRIFTPDMEIPYAGHPTLGTFFVLATMGRIKLRTPVTRAMMEVKAGVLPVDIHSKGGVISKVVTIQNKPVFAEPFEDVGSVADALSLKPSDFDVKRMPIQLVSTGLPWLIAPVTSRAAVEKASGNVPAFTKVLDRLPEHVVDIYLTCLDPVDKTSTTHSRGFSLCQRSIIEDPATGSASGCLGAYLVRNGLVEQKGKAKIINEQGYEIGRPSKISIDVSVEKNGAISGVEVGGSVVHVMDGYAYL